MINLTQTLEQTIRLMLEGKQVGIVYHFTKFTNLQYMVKPPSPFTLFSRNGYASFTRNRYMNLPMYSPNFREYDVRIALDGDKLSDRYQIEPIAGRPDDKPLDPKDIKRPTTARSSGEAEECIKIPVEGLDIRFAVMHVDILTRPYEYGRELDEDRMLQRLRNLNIPCTFDKRMS